MPPEEIRSHRKQRQRMHDDEVYEGWEPSPPHVTGRSYLYSLAPIGVGSTAIESLTGYIARLSLAHAVETGALVNHELLPRIPCTKGIAAGKVPRSLPGYSFYITAHTLNGVGHRARLWVSLLEQLTCRQRLDLLTTLPWAGTISCVHLLRTNRAWCPFCYGVESSSAGSAYERLLWALQMVTVCPQHRRPLESTCPFCGRLQYMFSSRSRPGYCSQCYRWLGCDPQTFTSGSDLTEQIAVAETIGALLVEAITLPTHLGVDLFRENVRGFVREIGGYRRFRAEGHSSHVRDWIRYAIIPRMDSLVKLCRSRNVSLIHLLTQRIQGGNQPDQKRTVKAHYRVAASAVEAALQAARQPTLTPPLQEIAKQLGYRTVTSLQYRFPALCSEIADRARKQTRTRDPRHCSSKAPVPNDEIEQALIKELHKASFTSLQAAALSVGLSSKRRLYKDGFRDLRLAIVAKNAAIRNQRVNGSENSLRAAFDESPIPTVTEVARRLGFATVKPLTSRFPELAAELRSRRLHPRPAPRVHGVSRRGHQVSPRVHQKLTEALVEYPPPSCAAIVRRLAGHRTQIRQDFPDLWGTIHKRYVEHRREMRQSLRQAAAREVYRVVAELHHRGVYPTIRLVLASIERPHSWSCCMISETVRLVRNELSIQPYFLSPHVYQA